MLLDNLTIALFLVSALRTGNGKQSFTINLKNHRLLILPASLNQSLQDPPSSLREVLGEHRYTAFMPFQKASPRPAGPFWTSFPWKFHVCPISQDFLRCSFFCSPSASSYLNTWTFQILINTMSLHCSKFRKSINTCILPLQCFAKSPIPGCLNFS